MSTSMVNSALLFVYDSMNRLCLNHCVISPTGHQSHEEVFISDGPLQAKFSVVTQLVRAL